MGIIGFGREGLAQYASLAMQSRGRFHAEPISPTRTPFQRDRDRIIHSTAFRRLKHKTQVFVYHEGDHYRTRLTHSIEVAQIARSLARALKVDEDLTEALALAHDLGHPPFGHAGETILDEMMQDFGGFDHNAQALRCVTKLEHQYAEFDGLNLSWETLEGLVKHNGPLNNLCGDDIPYPIAEFNVICDLELEQCSSIEAQCAAIADDIAYNAHDLDDGLRAKLFDLDSLVSLSLVGENLAEVRAHYPALEDVRVTHEVVRRQITAMVEDVISQSMHSLEQVNPSSSDDVRNAGRTIVTFSPKMIISVAAIKGFLYENMYHSPNVTAMRENAHIVMRNLFDAYFSGKAKMPDEWSVQWQSLSQCADEEKRARLVSDFLSGMTDKFAIDEHKRLFDVTPDLN